MVDLNGDGNVDLLSGSWPGELFWFAGDGDGDFAAPVMLQDKNGDFINIGGGIRDDGDRIRITGNATFEKTDEGTFVYYHGQRLESTAERPISITGRASVVHAADWDDDGDHDLIVGDIAGRVYLLTNEGSATDMQFGAEQSLQAGDKKIRVPGNVQDTYPIPPLSEGESVPQEQWDDAINWLLEKELLKSRVPYESSTTDKFISP